MPSIRVRRAGEDRPQFRTRLDPVAEFLSQPVARTRNVRPVLRFPFVVVYDADRRIGLDHQNSVQVFAPPDALFRANVIYRKCLCNGTSVEFRSEAASEKRIALDFAVF